MRRQDEYLVTDSCEAAEIARIARELYRRKSMRFGIVI